MTIPTMHFLGYTYPQHSQPQKSHNVELKFNRSLLITCIDGESPDLLNLFLMTYHSEQTSTRHYPKSWMHTGVFLLLLFFFFLAMPHGMWDLNSLPGIDSTGCAVEMQNPTLADHFFTNILKKHSVSGQKLLTSTIFTVFSQH